MTRLPSTIRNWVVAATFVLCAGLLLVAQDSGQSPSLGDVARSMRKERSAAGHVPGMQLVNEEEDGPDTTGIWRERLCTRTPCYELSIALPKNAKWTREKNEPRPVLLPLPGQDQDANRVIRLYNAESLGPTYSSIDGAKRLFLQSWFAKPEYFGQGARIALDEHVQLDGANGLISHFTVANAIKYRGLSIVAATSNGNYGFACVFREEDSAAAASICDAIVKSARNQFLEPGRRPYYPGYQPPPVYYYPQHYDPPEDPEDGDPE
jgi:hypothetical protein